MQKVKDLKSLEKFSNLYKDYRILNFESSDLNKKDYDSVLDKMRLSNGKLWPIPITLDISENTVEQERSLSTLNFLLKFVPKGIIILLYLK